MKRRIHESEDWRTDTPDPMINAFRQIMADSIDEQDDPYVGIFWYDVNKQELFGVRSTLASDRPFSDCSLFDHRARTCSPLHQSVWKKESFRHKDSRFSGDYTSVPRGRVFEVEDKGFVVITGSWIDKHPEAKAEIIYEFQLPENTTFQTDIHWDIGHGDSAQFL